MPNIKYKWAHIKLSSVAINLDCVQQKTENERAQ